MAAGTCGKVRWKLGEPEGEAMGGLDDLITPLRRLPGGE